MRWVTNHRWVHDQRWTAVNSVDCDLYYFNRTKIVSPWHARLSDIHDLVLSTHTRHKYFQFSMMMSSPLKYLLDDNKNSLLRTKYLLSLAKDSKLFYCSSPSPSTIADSNLTARNCPEMMRVHRTEFGEIIASFLNLFILVLWTSLTMFIFPIASLCFT